MADLDTTEWRFFTLFAGTRNSFGREQEEMPNLLDILLQRNDPGVPWGFQVRGGLDFGNCPVISSVTFGTLASQYLNAGDKILEIENQKGNSLLQSEINKLLQRDHPTLQLLVEKLPATSDSIRNRVPAQQRSDISLLTTAPNQPYEVMTEHEWIKEKKKSANGTKQSTKVWLREANRDSTLGEYDLQVNFERTKYKKKGEEDFDMDSTPSSNQKRMQMMTENFEKIFRQKVGEWLETNMLNGSTGKQQANPSLAGDANQSVQPPPPPPPTFPGTLPGRRIKTEIPERGLEPPSVIQNAMMTKDKKPFTYTPGGIDLSEIRSPKMQRRINRNACADEMPGIPAPTTNQSPPAAPTTNSHFSAMQSQLPAQVLPSVGGMPPPPPPPPPTNNTSETTSTPHPPPPAPSASVPKPNAGRPPLGFDPNELLARVNKSQPGIAPASNREEPPRNFKPQPSQEKPNFEPKQQKPNESGQNAHTVLQNEPGHIYVQQVAPKVQNEVHNAYVQPQATHPSRGQLGSIYIPPVATVNQEQSATSPSSPFGYKLQSNSPTVTPNAEAKPQAPWVTVYRTPQSSVPWANREPKSPKPASTRIIPIQVEGRDPPKPATPSPQIQTTPPPFLQSQHMRQAQQQQQSVRQQSPAQSQPSNTRVIPIQIEGGSQPAVSQQSRTPAPTFTQTKFNPMTPQSPTPFSPSQEKDQRPQWASVQPRPFKKEPESVAEQPPQQTNDVNRPQQPQYEYGTYNTAGVPLSQLRKMQLSDDDRALMDKFKSQVERQGNDIINDENSNPRYRGGYIPSRAFKALDESVDDEKYLHNESDPRYRGACIPSRAFRMLQCMTDTAGDMQQQVPKSSSRNPPGRPLSGTQFQQEPPTGTYVPPSEQQVQEPRKYTGGSIPSRSFKMLQAMTGNEVSAPSCPPSGRETPVPAVNRWCPSPSPSPIDPLWGYYPPDPFLMYNYISDLNAAYGFPPPPFPPLFTPPQPYSYYQPYQNYSSDNEEQGYSSTDELAQYYSNYRKRFGYSPYQPNPERFSTPNLNMPRVCITPVQDGKRRNHNPKGGQSCKPKEEREIRNEIKIEAQEGEEDAPSATENESELDTEVEDEENQGHQKGNSLQTLKSVPNINVYTSKSSSTIAQDEEDVEGEEEEEEEEDEDVSSSEGESEVKEEAVPHQLSVIFEESEHSDVESIKREEYIKSCSRTVSESESCSTLDNGEDDSDNDVMDAEASVTVRLPLKLKFSRSDNDEDITTVIVGDSEVERDTMYNLKAKKEPEEEIVEEDSNESEEGDVSVTFTIPSRSSSVISVKHSLTEVKDEKLPTEEIHQKSEIDTEEVVVRLPAPRSSADEGTETIEKTIISESPLMEDDSSSSSVQSGDTILKHKEDTDEDSEDDDRPKLESFKSWLEKENNKDWKETKTEETAEKGKAALQDNSYMAGVGRLEEMISSLLQKTKDTMSSSMELSEKDLDVKSMSESTMPLTKKDSQEESEEDDSGVTSDMSIKQMNSETDADTESDYSELSKMTKFQRASTHSRLFKLLQEECERCGNETGDENSTSETAPTSKEKSSEENLSLRKKQLTLPLNPTLSSEGDSLSSSSGIASPSSPTVSDRLVKELIHSLLNKKKGKKFRKLPLSKLRAAAIKILQEEMDPYDTSPTSGDDGLFLSPMQQKRLHSKLTAKFVDGEGNEPQYLEPVPESIYRENYYDYLDYYDTWGKCDIYDPEDYDVVPSRAFRLLREQTCSPKPIEGFKARCPRVTSKKNIQESPVDRKTPVVLHQGPDDPQYEKMTFAEKQEKISKVLEKAAKS